VLTLEDIAEELVGDIRDEDDPPEPTAMRQPNGSWTLPARWRIDQLEEATGIALPESDNYETLSGVILAVLGRLPEVGDIVEVEQLPESTISEEPPNTATITVLSVEHGVADTINILSKEPEQ